ncbi:MAG: NAD-dependent epimerase/dehydratase family protein [Planctomycetaceae bacterium]|nr:NAD-dependent epimerase/dehydratase family protein [Planctomycetaceae bacterium]
MACWLITGATGFVGRHVLELLKHELKREQRTDDEIVVLGRRRPPGWPEERFVAADLAKPETLGRAVKTVLPDYVIHTAGRTPPAADEVLLQANFWGTIQLLKALRGLNRRVKVTLAGSAAELGPVPPAKLPVSESYPPDPVDAYGRSKHLATIAALAEWPPLEVSVARVFNPVGPGMPPTQAFGEFATQLLAPGADPLPLLVGELETKRDFIDVRDVARALIALALRGQSGLAYHVGSGVSRSVREGLELLLRQSGRTVRLCVDPHRRERKGPVDSRADIRRITQHTGWLPEISLEQSLADFWHERLAQHVAAAAPVAARLPLTAEIAHL